MPTSRLFLLVMANLSINLGLIWLLYCSRSRRRQATRDELVRSARLLGQQVKVLEVGKEVME